MERIVYEAYPYVLAAGITVLGCISTFGLTFGFGKDQAVLHGAVPSLQEHRVENATHIESFLKDIQNHSRFALQIYEKEVSVNGKKEKRFVVLMGEIHNQSRDNMLVGAELTKQFKRIGQEDIHLERYFLGQEFYDLQQSILEGIDKGYNSNIHHLAHQKKSEAGDSQIEIYNLESSYHPTVLDQTAYVYTKLTKYGIFIFLPSLWVLFKLEDHIKFKDRKLKAKINKGLTILTLLTLINTTHALSQGSKRSHILYESALLYLVNPSEAVILKARNEAMFCAIDKSFEDNPGQNITLGVMGAAHLRDSHKEMAKYGFDLVFNSGVPELQ